MEGAIDHAAEREGVAAATSARNILLLPRMEVNRKGLPVKAFARSVTPVEAAALLRPDDGDHTWVEYFHGDAITKFYYDTERYFKARPTPEVEAAYLAEVRVAMDVIVEFLGCACPRSKVTYVVAQRHGLCGDKGGASRYKLSFRTFVSGAAVVYHRIPYLMKDVASLKATLHLWDDSVYKKGEQLLSAIGGHKKDRDRRVLAPLEGWDACLEVPPSKDAAGSGILQYVASYVDPAWQVANTVIKDDEDEAETVRRPPVVGGFADADADPRVLALLGMLGVASASDRKEWIRVAILLKHLGGGGDLYLESWLAFSRLAKASGSYVDDRDCIQTWKGLGLDVSKRGELTLGTLCRLAKQDDPEGYRRWRRGFRHLRLLPNVSDAASTASITSATPTTSTAPTNYATSTNYAVPTTSTSAVPNVADIVALTNASGQKQSELLKMLQERFPQLGLDAVTFRIVRDDAEGLTFEDATPGLSGCVDAPVGGFWGYTVRVKSTTTGDKQFLSFLSGDDIKVQGSFGGLHKNIPAEANSYIFSQPKEDRAVLRSVAPEFAGTITLMNPKDNANKSISIVIPGSHNHTVTMKKKVDEFNTRMCAVVANEHQQHNNTLNLFGSVAANTVNVINTVINEAEDRSQFDRLRDEVLQVAEAGRLRKLDGHIWRPVPGCVFLAYKRAETYRVFLNATLRGCREYMHRVTHQEDLLKVLANYDPDEIRDVVFDRGMLSFSDGVLVTRRHATDRWKPEMLFVRYDDAEGIAALKESAESSLMVARHHIDQAYAPSVGAPMPLFDGLLNAQFAPAVVHMLHVLLGRLLFPLGQHDDWQVVPWLVGIAGAGKTVIQDVVTAMFPVGMVGTLSGNNELIFGLEAKFAKHVVLGRDLPRHMNSVLPQTLLQCMVSGESISVPRKGQVSIDLPWTAPMLCASNALPDYSDSDGQIGRRLVTFPFIRSARAKEEGLAARIVETELAAIISCIVTAYFDAVRLNRGAGFWNMCPEDLLKAKRDVAVATSHVRRFLSLGPTDKEAEINDDEVVYVRHDAGACTSIVNLKRAYDDHMKHHHPSVVTTETIRKETMELAGFETKKKNACGTCKCAVKGGRCCALYDSAKRVQLDVVLGITLVREKIGAAALAQ
jgi:hypothetical protein